MKYKMFVSDYDGTLGDPTGIKAETVSAVKEYERRGGKFVICTGRMLTGIARVCDPYDIADVYVSYQGARINERKSGKTLFKGTFDNAFAAEILRAIKGCKVISTLITDGVLYYSEESRHVDGYKNSQLIEVKKVPDIIKFVEDKGTEVLKLNVYCDGEDVFGFMKEFGKKYEGRAIVNSGGSNLVEFVNPACSKGAAVRFLAKYYGIGYDEIIAVGDSTNDIELVRGEWHGVAVGDGMEELKKHADEITVPYKEQPIKHLLEKYCL
ncbi:MAG: HAD family phosphatase [Clostridia bacterium]|nr:HAD family phosphatase [Clostridia bacterium]